MIGVRALGALLAVPLVLPASSGCAGLNVGGIGAAACPAFATSGDPLSMRFSVNARANARIRTFVAAARSISEVSLQMEALAADACLRMGRDLGVPDAQLVPAETRPGSRARAACGAVSAAIDTISRQGVRVSARVIPPECQASADARARCDAACNVELEPAEIVAQCEPGQLSGQCVGQCQGRCDGTCGGECQGTCAARDASGRCAGRCDGVCRGPCSGTCHARCEGEWRAPRCEGRITPPSAEAECRASCDAYADVRASCTPAVVHVTGAEQTAQAARLVATLQANLPTLVYAEIALGARLIEDARSLVRVGQELPRLVGDAAAEGLACIAAGAGAAVEASARIEVSVQASASVTGRVAAG